MKLLRNSSRFSLKNAAQAFVILLSLLAIQGCVLPNLYKEHLRDYGFGHKASSVMPVFIPMVTVGTNVEAYAESGGFTILGDSRFQHPLYSAYDSIPVAQKLGATHVLFGRAYIQTIEIDELRTGYSAAQSFSSGHVSSSFNTYGNLNASTTTYSPYSGYTYGTASGIYNSQTFGSHSYSGTTTTYVPYQYAVRVAVPYFDYTAVYLKAKGIGNAH